MAPAAIFFRDTGVSLFDMKRNASRATVRAISMNERLASDTSSPRLSSASASDSISGIPASAAPVKSPASPGKTMNTKQKPAVTANAVDVARNICRMSYSYLKILSSTTNPSTGSVTCRMTRAIDTVLNLLYRGAYSNHSFVNHIKWLPHASMMAMTVAMSSHHFSLPRYRHSPRMNRKTVMAPIYIGPAVKGCGPQ